MCKFVFFGFNIKTYLLWNIKQVLMYPCYNTTYGERTREQRSSCKVGTLTHYVDKHRSTQCCLQCWRIGFFFSVQKQRNVHTVTATQSCVCWQGMIWQREKFKITIMAIESSCTCTGKFWWQNMFFDNYFNTMFSVAIESLQKLNLLRITQDECLQMHIIMI